MNSIARLRLCPPTPKKCYILNIYIYIYIYVYMYIWYTYIHMYDILYDIWQYLTMYSPPFELMQFAPVCTQPISFLPAWHPRSRSLSCTLGHFSRSNQLPFIPRERGWKHVYRNTSVSISRHTHSWFEVTRPWGKRARKGLPRLKGSPVFNHPFRPSLIIVSLRDNFVYWKTEGKINNDLQLSL